jgi:hypothetical protein
MNIDKMVKSKEQIRGEHEKKPVLDKYTIIHFFFGCGLGWLLGLLLNIFVLALIMGLLLIPFLEYITHRIAIGYATLTTKNALVDLSFAALGLILILIILHIT